MKKKLIIGGLAAALTAGASAQPSITIFGTVDVAVQRMEQGGTSATIVNGMGGNFPSRIGFMGKEDLGDGLSANFLLEAGLNVDNGSGGAVSTNNQSSGTSQGLSALMFNRRSYVALSSTTWGEVRLGREYPPTYWNASSQFDPFTNVGAGALNRLVSGALNQNTGPTVQTVARASNAVTYLTPGTLGGFYGQVMYAMGENASDIKAPAGRHDGNYIGVRAGYAKGALNTGMAYGVNKFASGDVSITNFAISYDFGVIKPRLAVFRDKRDAAVAPTAANGSRGFMVGATIPAGSGYIPISYATVRNNRSAAPGNARANQYAVGYVYELSKRTALYSTYAFIDNKNGAALTGGGVTGVANERWKGLDLGIRHHF